MPESFLKKEKRLKKRRQIYKATYSKQVVFFNKEKLIEWVNQNDVIMYVNSGGLMDDETEFIQLTIEGFKP